MKTRFVKLMTIMVVALAIALTGAAFAEQPVDTQKLDTYYSLAIEYINREDYDKAMDYLNACLEYCDEASKPELCADIHLKKGCVYTLTQSYDEALTELDEASRIDENLSEAWLVKTQAFTDSERYPEAIEALQKYIDMTGDNNMYETMSQLYAQTGDTEKATEVYNQYIELSSESDIEVSYRKGTYKMGAGQFAEAVEDFAPCLEDETYGASSAYNTGVCHLNLGSYEEALASFDKSVEAGGNYDGIHYNRGVCLMSLGRYDEAVEAFGASIDGESYKDDATYNRAVCHMSAGGYDDAIADFTAYIDSRAAAAQPAEGEETEETEAASTVDVANYYRGVCYLSNGDYENAVNDFTVCMDNGVAAEDSLFNRGLSYLQGGEYESAKADFDACVEQEINADAARYYRAFAYRYLGDNEAALQDLTDCIDHEYNLGQSYYQRAQVYNDMNDDEHYVEDLEASLNY